MGRRGAGRLSNLLKLSSAGGSGGGGKTKMKMPGSGNFLIPARDASLFTMEELLTVIFSLPFPSWWLRKGSAIFHRTHLTKPMGG